MLDDCQVYHAFGKSAQLWHPHVEYLTWDTAPTDRARYYRTIVADALPTDVAQKIRALRQSLLVLGVNRFVKRKTCCVTSGSTALIDIRT